MCVSLFHTTLLRLMALSFVHIELSRNSFIIVAINFPKPTHSHTNTVLATWLCAKWNRNKLTETDKFINWASSFLQSHTKTLHCRCVESNSELRGEVMRKLPRSQPIMADFLNLLSIVIGNISWFPVGFRHQIFRPKSVNSWLCLIPWECSKQLQALV